MRPEQIFLAFDTSAAHCAAALLADDRVLFARVEEMERGQAERLMPLLDDLLAGAEMKWSDLSAICVGVGPGNFTGIRIAVSAARGLGLGLGIPVIGVSLFQTTGLLANSAQVAVPAPRGQAYFLDLGKMAAPILTEASHLQAVALSTAFGAEAHVKAIARIAADHLTAGRPVVPPAPLYVRAADAAPAADPPPVILP